MSWVNETTRTTPKHTFYALDQDNTPLVISQEAGTGLFVLYDVITNQIMGEYLSLEVAQVAYLLFRHRYK